MEQVLDAGLAMQRGRVFMDLWDCERFYPCGECGPRRQERMHQMNLTQQVLPPVVCSCSAS